MPQRRCSGSVDDGDRRVEVEPEILCEGRQRLFECRNPHQTPELMSAFASSVGAPLCQLQAHSSSVCRASRTRSTSSTLRPTDPAVTDRELDDAIGVDDERRPVGDAVAVEHAEIGDELAVEVREHREWKLLQVIVLGAPSVVDVLVVDRSPRAPGRHGLRTRC